MIEAAEGNGMAKKAAKKAPATKGDKRYALPKFKGRMELHDAIDGLMAYDHGATDSGISDPALRHTVGDYVRKLTKGQQNRLMMGFIHDRMHPPYGVEDMFEFLRWMRDTLGVEVSGL